LQVAGGLFGAGRQILVAIGNLHRGDGQGIDAGAYFAHHGAQLGGHARHGVEQHAELVLAFGTGVMGQVSLGNALGQVHGLGQGLSDRAHQLCGNDQHAESHDEAGDRVGDGTLPTSILGFLDSGVAVSFQHLHELTLMLQVGCGQWHQILLCGIPGTCHVAGFLEFVGFAQGCQDGLAFVAQGVEGCLFVGPGDQVSHGLEHLGVALDQNLAVIGEALRALLIRGEHGCHRDGQCGRGTVVPACGGDHLHIGVEDLVKGCTQAGVGSVL